MAWNIVCPEAYVDGKHIRIIADALQDTYQGSNHNLLINIPPGHSKSLLTSILYPAWLWIRNPGLRIICGSHSLGLATDFSITCRQLIESSWYQSNWGYLFQLSGDANTKTYFANDKQGERSIASPSSKPTGKSAEVIIIDDAHDILDTSAPALQNTIDWYEAGLVSRIRNPEQGIIIVIGQRVALDDISGYIIKKEQFNHINLPAVYTGHDASYEFRTVDGELLWPERYNKEFLEDRHKALGTRSYEALYGQNPSIPGGAIIKTSWFSYYKQLPPKFDSVVQSWDLTFTGGEKSDYVVGLVLGRKGGDFFLIDLVRGRWSFTETIRQIRQLSSKYPEASTKLIEQAANGAAAIDTLRHEISGIVPIKSSKSKLVRLKSVEGILEAGNLHLPEIANWLNDFEFELTSFTGTSSDKNDDQVDALVQALIKFQSITRNQVVSYTYG
jgi:predicted phage terminase large subunit-like protein